MIVFVLAMLLVFLKNTISGYIEKVEVSGCESCRIMLTCRRLDSIIAILDIDFTAENSTLSTGLIKKKSQAFPPDHPRDAINQRCSGLNHCSFILTEDSPGSEAWGAGNLTVKYACVTQDRVQRYCNSHVVLKEKSTAGIIINPGYPRFYAGQKKCTWQIVAPPHQKLKLTILDLSLFDTKVSSPEECKDILEIKDTGQTIYSSCAQEHPPFELISGSESVEVVLSSRQNFNPRRGVLMYYSAIGCPLPVPPKKGHLVFGNDTVATFACCQGYAFPDTGTQTKTLGCLGAAWNISLPLLDCEESGKLVQIKLQEVVQKARSMASELIVPILIMLLLFAANGVVLFFIHKARKNADRRTRFSNQPQLGRGSYGSMDNKSNLKNATYTGMSLKSQMKNWALSVRADKETKCRRP